MLRATGCWTRSVSAFVTNTINLRTEQAYALWVRMFVKWHGLRHLRDMGQQEVEGLPAIMAE